MKIIRMDGSLAVKLPDDLVTSLELKEGDEVEVVIRGKTTPESELSREEMIAEMRRNARPLPPGYKFDREEANRRR
jgi:antitoxin MazE